MLHFPKNNAQKVINNAEKTVKNGGLPPPFFPYTAGGDRSKRQPQFFFCGRCAAGAAARTTLGLGAVFGKLWGLYFVENSWGSSWLLDLKAKEPLACPNTVFDLVKHTIVEINTRINTNTEKPNTVFG